MNQYDTAPAVSLSADEAVERIVAFLRAVYGWMAVGLGITALTAAFVASSPGLMVSIVRTPPLFWGLMIAQLGIVLLLSSRVHKLAAPTAAALFIAYSCLTGVTMSFVLLVYTGESVATTFVVTLAGYGTLTGRSLAGWGQFLFMGLVGVVIASLVGLVWHSDAQQFVTAFIGVIVFTGLTAYDANRLKAMALVMPDGQTRTHAIVGALALYLDFINLFLMLLRLFGGRRR
jgi:FtsH-binding integral membrane protein